METSKRRVGRPKAVPQTGPLVLTERRARTKVEIEISADTAQHLAAYVRWVELSEGMSTADACAATVEFALRNVFKRDQLWHDWRRKDDRGEGEQAAAAAASPQAPQAAQATAPSPSLPPVSGPRPPNSTTPSASR
jgi:hypothetical protein